MLQQSGVFVDMCKSVKCRLYAFDCKVDEAEGTACMVLDSVHRIMLAHLSLFPCINVKYRRDDRRYVVRTEASEGIMRHNAMLVEYDRMASFYGISDIAPLKEAIDGMHKNANVCFHKIVKQGNVFVAIFNASSDELRLNTGNINGLGTVSTAWIELHPDTKEMRICASLHPMRSRNQKRKRRGPGAEDDDENEDNGGEVDSKKQRRIVVI